jgi:hypothetical protein
MKRIWTAALAAFAMLATSLTPAPAMARDDHGYGGYGRGYGGHYYHHGHGDAVAAGAVGLILGLAVGSALSEPRYDRYDSCDRCGPPPPPRCYDGCGYDGRRADYERDYYGDSGRDGDVCVRQVRQWDPYAGRYVWVNLRRPC